MFQRKRRLKKEEPRARLKGFILSLLFIALFLGFFSIIYSHFYFSQYPYISPLSPQERNTLALKAQDQLVKANIPFENLTINTENSVVINLKSGGSVIFSPKKDLNSQITSLQLMLSRLTIEGKKLKTLDFRYDNPVVSFD